MNILHLLSSKDSPGVIGEVEELSRCLISKGHQCVIGASVEIKALVEQGKGGQEDNCYWIPSYERNFTDISATYRRLKEIIRQKDIDVVVAHSPLNSWLAFWLCRNTNTSLVTSVHSFYPKNILNYSSVLGEKVIVHSQALGNYLIDNFSLFRERLNFICHSLDLEKYPFRYEEQSRTDFKVGIILPGSSFKGQEYLLRAMAVIQRSFPYLKFYMVTCFDMMHSAAKRDLLMGINRLRLEPCVQLADDCQKVKNLFPDFNLLIISSLKEGFSSRFLAQAQAYGVPSLAAQLAGVEELVEDGKTGITFPLGDDKTLSGLVIKALNSPLWLKEIKLSARKKIEDNFDLNKNVEGFLQIYAQARNIQRALVINAGNIRDVASSINVLKVLKTQKPNVKISVLTKISLRSLFCRCPYIDELIIYDRSNKRINNFIYMAFLLIKRRFDFVFDFNRSSSTRFLAYLSLAKKRFFLAREKKYPYSGPIEDKLSILEPFGLKIKDYNVQLWAAQEDKDFVDSFLRDNWVGQEKLVGIDVSSNPGAENISLDCLSYLCEQLNNQNMRVVLISWEKCLSVEEKLFRKTNARPILALGNMSILRLIYLIKKCDIYITPNFENFYVANAMNVPSIVFSLDNNKNNKYLYRDAEILTKEDLILPKKKKKQGSKAHLQNDALKEKIDRVLKKDKGESRIELNIK